MNEIVIFEGPDRCGKTEISHALSKIRGLSYFKNHQEHKNFTQNKFNDTAFIEAAYLIDMLKQVQFANNGIILDRHMPSEYVYSQVFNRQTDMNAIWQVDEQLSMLGAVIIYCYKDFYKEYEDEVIDLQHIENIKEKYETYFEQTSMPICYLNTTDENLEREIMEIQEFLEEIQDDD